MAKLGPMLGQIQVDFLNNFIDSKGCDLAFQVN
jgi:hypothetical protein